MRDVNAIREPTIVFCQIIDRQPLSDDCSIGFPDFPTERCSLCNRRRPIFQLRFLKVATQALETPVFSRGVLDGARLPVSVIIAARNEAKNLGRCLESLRAAGEV